MATNTAIGNAIGIPFKRFVQGNKIDIPPELLDSLCGIWIADQNTNESPTRNIIKNKLPNKGGDFEILNAAYKLNSGYGLTVTDFSSYRQDVGTSEGISEITSNSFVVKDRDRYALIFKNYNSNDIDIESYEVDMVISKHGNNNLSVVYYYYDETGKRTAFVISESGRYTVPKSYISKGTTSWSGWYVHPNVTCSIKQVVKYQGAFCADGVDDLIVSQKPVSEILGGSNEITVVSMMANLDSRQMLGNSIFSNNAGYNARNTLEANNVTSILGYTDSNGTTNNLNLIMGDKGSIKLVDKVRFDTNRSFYPINYPAYYYKSAWYWTFIAKRVLTTDEINQVIAYYNLDKYVAPDVYYDVKKQGLTNENHAEFGDKLIDYSGNGKDMQLYNFGWKLNSGVGKYEIDFTIFESFADTLITHNKLYAHKGIYGNIAMLAYDSMSADINSYIVKVKGIIDGKLIYYYRQSNGIEERLLISKDGIYTIPKSHKTDTGTGANTGFVLSGNQIISDDGLTIEQLPSYENSVVFDGVEDYGKVEGLPILKDYTVVADRRFIGEHLGAVISKSYDANQGAFYFESGVSVASFGKINNLTIKEDIDISYLSKYVYNDDAIQIGTGVDSDKMWIGVLRDNDYRFSKIAMYSAMLFPYSLSEFLIYRQLIKHKLIQTNMVIFLPILDINNYIKVEYYTEDLTARLDINKWFPKGYNFVIKIWMPKFTDISKATFQNTDCIVVPTNDNDISSDSNNSYYIHCVNVKRYAQIVHIETEEGGDLVDFSQWTLVKNPTVIITANTINLTNVQQSGLFIEIMSTTLVIPSFKIRVSGVTKGRGVAYHYCKADGTYNMNWYEQDGEYITPESIHSQKQSHSGFRVNFVGECDILIEQIK